MATSTGMPTKRDYYEVLGIERTAAAAEIKTAYRKLARQHHPDVNPDDPSAEEKFKEVQEAYDVLSDDRKREVYDRYGHEAAQRGGPGAGGPGGFDPFGGFGDIFDVFFGGQGAAQGRRAGPQRGADLRYDLEVTLEEAYAGVEKPIRIPRIENCDTCSGSGAAPGTKPEKCPVCNGAGQVRRTQNTILGTIQSVAPCDRCSGRGQIVKTPCQTCEGRGRVRKQRDLTVDVPPGVDDGMQMPLRGEGEAGALGGPPGDLYIFFHVKEHPIFERDGSDLYAEVPVTFTQAALGDDIPVPTIGGEKGRVTVPEGTQTGTRFRLRNLGMPDVRSPERRGDLNVVVKVQTPTKLTDEERDLLRKLATVRGEKAGENPPPPHKGWFDRLKETITGHDG
jgi:molecular chaperone DnaJ